MLHELVDDGGVAVAVIEDPGSPFAHTGNVDQGPELGRAPGLSDFVGEQAVERIQLPVVAIGHLHVAVAEAEQDGHGEYLQAQAPQRRRFLVIGGDVRQEPGRQNHVDDRSAAGVGVGVELHVYPFVDGPVDDFQGPVAGRPCLCAHEDKVRELELHAGAAGHFYHLLQGNEIMGPAEGLDRVSRGQGRVGPGVYRQYLVLPADQPRDVGEFVEAGEDARLVLESQGNAAGPLVHRLFQEFQHFGRLFLRQRRSVEAPDGGPGRSVSRQHGQVVGEAVFSAHGSVFLQRTPGQGVEARLEEVVGYEGKVLGPDVLLYVRGAETAVAAHHGGYALARKRGLEFHPPRRGEEPVIVAVQVDEARRDDHAGAVYRGALHVGRAVEDLLYDATLEQY